MLFNRFFQNLVVLSLTILIVQSSFAVPPDGSEAAASSEEWILGQFLQQEASENFSWTTGDTIYQARKIQGNALRTFKYQLEKVMPNGHPLQLGLLKIKKITQKKKKDDSITLVEKPFVKGGKDMIYTFIDMASPDILRMRVRSRAYTLDRSHDEWAFASQDPTLEKGNWVLNTKDRSTLNSNRNFILEGLDKKEAVRLGRMQHHPFSLDYVPSLCSPAFAMAAAVISWHLKPEI